MTNPVSRCSATSRDGRIRTGEPLNPIRRTDGLNHGKKPCKSLAGRTICYSCPSPMLTSAVLNRHINRPNRHTKRPKNAHRPIRTCSFIAAPLTHTAPRTTYRWSSRRSERPRPFSASGALIGLALSGSPACLMTGQAPPKMPKSCWRHASAPTDSVLRVLSCESEWGRAE
jgi:hypothetical protein